MMVKKRSDRVGDTIDTHPSHVLERLFRYPFDPRHEDLGRSKSLFTHYEHCTHVILSVRIFHHSTRGRQTCRELRRLYNLS